MRFTSRVRQYLAARFFSIRGQKGGSFPGRPGTGRCSEGALQARSVLVLNVRRFLHEKTEENGGLNVYDILVLVIALVLFTVLAFLRAGAMPLATIVALITCILAGLSILDTLLGPFMSSAAGYVQDYCFVFFLGAVFSALYEGSNGAKSIALFLSEVTGGKHVAVLIFIVTSILTYGGISGFVIYFVMYPICLQLFQKDDLSRILIPAAITAGCWTVSMVAPDSPSVQNVVVMNSLGTASTAALIPGLLSVLTEFVLIVIWFEYRTWKLGKMGRHFEDATLPPLPDSERNFSEDPEERRPNVVIAFIPIAVILVLFNGFQLPAEATVFFGILTACVLFKPYLPSVRTYIDLFNQGGTNAINALLNTAIVVGFGGVAQETIGFQKIVNGVLSMDISPLVFVAIAVAVCAGMCGSASGGMGIAFNALKDTFISLGLNLEYVHRIAVIAAGTLDTLPHQGGQITIFAITHMNHKTAYWDICMTQLIIPLITVFAVTIPLCSLGL